MISGPGVKKNYKMEKPSQLQDQYPTIMHLLGEKPGTDVDGRILKEILR